MTLKLRKFNLQVVTLNPGSSTLLYWSWIGLIWLLNIGWKTWIFEFGRGMDVGSKSHYKLWKLNTSYLVEDSKSCCTSDFGSNWVWNFCVHEFGWVYGDKVGAGRTFHGFVGADLVYTTCFVKCFGSVIVFAAEDELFDVCSMLGEWFWCCMGVCSMLSEEFWLCIVWFGVRNIESACVFERIVLKLGK